MPAIESGRRGRSGIALALALLAASGGACSRGDQPAGGGNPVLLYVYWTGMRAGDGQALVWSSNPADMLQTTVTAAPFEIDLVFDRRLDGDKIEDTQTINGVMYTVPKQMPPVTVAWDGMSPTAPGVSPLTVAYNSLSLAGAPTASTYVFVRADVGYPSATALTFHIDKAALTSPDNQPMVGPDGFSVTTQPFAVQIHAPPTPDAGAAPVVPADFQFPLAFNSQPGDVASIQPFVAFTVDGAAAPFRLVINGNDPLTVYVSPPQAGQTWPAGAHIDVAVNAGLPDVFGVPLAAAASASFVITGRAADAGAPDAGASTDASDDGATDAAGDAS